MRAQVVYRQGLVKDFVCHDGLTLAEFMRQASAFGKVRLLRSLKVVADVGAELESGGSWMGGPRERDLAVAATSAAKN
jgi:hypothetical protein